MLYQRAAGPVLGPPWAVPGYPLPLHSQRRSPRLRTTAVCVSALICLSQIVMQVSVGMHSDSDEATAKPSEPVWAGWALPVDADNKLLLSISMYASDVLAFATAFLTRCGFIKVHRQAPAAIASESFVSIEDRNKNAVEDGFVRERFTKDVEAKLKACGVIPAYMNQYMQQLDRQGLI